MSTTLITMPSQIESPWTLPSRGRVGMFCLIAAESAIFTIFVVAYLFYHRQEPFRAHAERRARASDLQFDLPAFEQPDDSFRRRARCEGQDWMLQLFGGS